MRKFLLSVLVFILTPFCLFAEKPLDFTRAGRMAVEASTELKNEYMAASLREGVWRWGIRAYLPGLSISASEDDRLSETGADSFLKNYSVNLDQLLWDGGRLSLSRKMERAELDFAKNGLKQMASDITENTVSAYRDVLQGRRILEISENTLESLQEQRRIMRREAGLGLVRPIDLAEADITIALQELDNISLAMDLEEAEWRLTEKLGLEELPLLSERIDTGRVVSLPSTQAVKAIAESRNQELAAFRYSIVKRQAELKAASLSWIPSLRMTGSFALSGRNYPLSRYSWSVGLVVDFSSPWLSGNLSAVRGGDPPYDKNARLQQTMAPAPNPGASLSVRSAELALVYERSRYEAALKEVRSAAERGIKECSMLDKKRILAAQALELEEDKFRLAEIKLSLGEITRLDLMEARLDYAKREAALVDAAVQVQRAERALERLLDIGPGDLPSLAGMAGI